ncbi:type II toxin-antitoxin system PemK/MazF family toxin [Oryzomonas sp.]|uniref:type II toxin-antitoxin system PemK/MazF family toxin n=1 Tax=Oryzomonas sp. TaxID=2855186 RepID=UPI0038D40F3B
MPLTFHPQPGTVLICDFSTGFKAPEIIKRRPVVVISPRPRRKTQLCIVVPLSTTPPVPVETHHHCLDPASLPATLAARQTWAKCDILMTVSLQRLDRVKMGKDPATGKRIYSSGTVTPSDFKAIQKSVLAALGLYRLTTVL